MENIIDIFDKEIGYSKKNKQAKIITFRIDESLYNQIMFFSKVRNQTTSKFLKDMIYDYIKNMFQTKLYNSEIEYRNK